MSSLRRERLADEIRDVVSSCFLGGRIEDPRLQGLTITAAKITGDLQMAYIYFRLYDPTTLASTNKGLESIAGYLRSQLAKQLKIRKVPELKFFYDESIETGAKIEGLLSKIKSETDA